MDLALILALIDLFNFDFSWFFPNIQFSLFEFISFEKTVPKNMRKNRHNLWLGFKGFCIKFLTKRMEFYSPVRIIFID